MVLIRKTLKAYYAKQSTADKNNTKTESGKEDTGTALSSLKSSSGKLSEAASVLKNVDFDKEVSDDTVKKSKGLCFRLQQYHQQYKEHELLQYLADGGMDEEPDCHFRGFTE